MNLWLALLAYERLLKGHPKGVIHQSGVVDMYANSCFLELDAEFDGEAVVGIVLPVAARMVPDGSFPLS